MKNECSYVRDILPLFLENMVSEETSTFVKEHLENCPECAAELESIKAGEEVEKVGSELRDNLETEVLKSMQAIRKKNAKESIPSSRRYHRNYYFDWCTASYFPGLSHCAYWAYDYGQLL